MLFENANQFFSSSSTEADESMLDAFICEGQAITHEFEIEQIKKEAECFVKTSRNLQEAKVMFLTEGFWESIKNFFLKIWNWIKEKASAVWNWIKNLFGGSSALSISDRWFQLGKRLRDGDKPKINKTSKSTRKEKVTSTRYNLLINKLPDVSKGLDAAIAEVAAETVDIIQSTSEIKSDERKTKEETIIATFLSKLGDSDLESDDKKSWSSTSKIVTRTFVEKKDEKKDQEVEAKNFTYDKIDAFMKADFAALLGLEHAGKVISAAVTKIQHAAEMNAKEAGLKATKDSDHAKHFSSNITFGAGLCGKLAQHSVSFVKDVASAAKSVLSERISLVESCYSSLEESYTPSSNDSNGSNPLSVFF